MKNLDLQIGKIVGGSNNLFWSQTHVFLPKDKEKKELFGSLLATFCLKAKEDKVDIISFGKEIISRFHEVYYSSSSLSGLQRLKKGLQILNDEFSQAVEIEMAVAAVFSSGLVYFASNTNAKVFILRNNHLVEILFGQEEIKCSSGFLEKNDLVILATDQFYRLIPLSTLRQALVSKQVDEAIESLAPAVQANKENNQTAAIILKIIIEKTTRRISIAQLLKIKPSLAVFSNRLKNIKTEAGFVLQKRNKSIKVRVKDEIKERQSKKTTLTIALILIVLLVISVVLGIKKRESSRDVNTVRLLTKKVESQYKEAISLEEFNPLRARSILIEVNNSINEKIDEIQNKQEREKISKLQEKIKQELEKVAKSYKLEKGEIFLDLSLAKENFQASNWAINEKDIYIFDQEKGTVLQVAVGNKSCRIAAGGKRLAEGKLIGAGEKRIFILTALKIFVVDLAKAEIIDEVEAQEWGEIVDLVGFSNNAYLLDKQKGQIWKYSSKATGLAKKTAYLKAESNDLNQAVSLAVDGSVWTLDSQGNIIKFVRGKKDFFNVSGLDKQFNEPIKIYTSKDVDNLYVLDRKNTRIVVINKETGEYQAQYIWPGIAGVTDLAAFEKEKEILLLSGDKIYKIEIRE